MKKIIFILFLLLSFFSCYIIYNLTEKKENNCLILGDTSINLTNIQCNNSYINPNIHINDLYNQIYYNIQDNNNNPNIHQLLNKSNILIISIGQNDIDEKTNKSTKEIYTYINELLSTLEKTFKLINKYTYDKVIVLGFTYPKENKDIYVYANYKLKKVTENNKYIYIDKNNIKNTNINEIITKIIK